MPARSSLTSFNAPVTQASLSAAIQTAMTKAGFSALFDQVTSSAGLLSLVYQLILDDTATGTLYLEIQISSALAIQQRLLTAWNATTHTPGTVATALSIAVTFSGSANFQAISIDHPECRQVILSQAVTSGTNDLLLGYLRPAEIPDWWRRDLYPFAFFLSAPGATPSTSVYGFGGAQSPFANNSYVLTNIAQMANANSANSNRASVLTGAEMLFTAANQGEVGKFSSEIAVCAANTQKRGDVLNTGATGMFLLLTGGTSSLGVLSNVPS